MNKQEIEKAIEYLENQRHYWASGNLIDYINTAISALTQQLNDGWIPVSERLPKKEEANENDDVLTTRLGIVMIIKYWQVSPFNAIAWQPLPEPYKEVNNDRSN